MNIALSGCPAVSIPPVIIVTPPVVTPVTGDVSIDGITLMNPSKRPFVAPIHSGISGAGSQINAYSMSLTRCIAAPLLARSWQHNIDLVDFRGRTAREIFAIRENESLTYKFTAPDVDAAGGFTYQENVASGANTAPVFISVSTRPCDFDVARVGPPFNSCYQTGINGLGLNWANLSSVPFAYCRLTKGQTYYLNVRFQDARPGSPAVAPGLYGGSLAFN